MIARVLLAVVLASAFATGSPALAANQVVANCADDTELRNDLAAMQASDGGTLTFSCATTTIVLTADLPTITKTTTVDGGGKITLSGGNARRVFVVAASGALALKHLALTNGSSPGDGGAIFSNGSMLLQDVAIRDSLSGQSGGAFVTYGPALLEDCEFSGNEALNGGAVYARFPPAPVTIRRSYLHDNRAGGISDAYGGAVFLWDGASVVIEDSVLAENRAVAGSAIYNGFSNSSVTVTRSLIAGNAAAGGRGAGIHVSGGPLLVTDCEFSSNSSPSRGGGIYYANGNSATIERSTLENNRADQGGAVAVVNSTGVSIVNVTMSANRGESGTGFHSDDSQASLVHVTIAGSPSPSDVSALHHFSNSGRTTTLKNVLLADNLGPNCSAGSFGLVSSDGNVSDDGSCAGVFNQPHDEDFAATLLGPLGQHGGPTRTQVPQPGSDAVNGGVSTNLPPSDQRGLARLQGASVDAGAVEVVPCSAGAALCGDANQSQSLSASDALAALRTAVGSEVCAAWLCDYDGSGTITASDALAILRASVGQSTSPACPPKWDCRVLELPS